MTARKLLIFLAFLLEVAAAAGVSGGGIGTIHVSLVAAGLAAYFLAELA